MDYQVNKAIGKCFRAKDNQFLGLKSILGIPYTYKVVAGIPEKDCMLEVVGYEEDFLLVVVNNSLFESDVNFIG